MRSRRALIAMSAGVLLFAAVRTADVRAQPGDERQAVLDDAVRAAVVDSLTAAIDSVYVLAEPAARIVAGLRANLAAGAYADLTDPRDLAQRLESDAQAINHDGHFAIRALPPVDSALREAGRDEDPAAEERQERLARAANYGFRKAEILPGGVGYLRFDRFANGDEAFAAGAAAMNFLANSNAVILDLRANGGGAGSMIRFLCGYLFPERAHLINWDVRVRDETIQSYSADFVPGRRLTEQPVYVLTSGSTFSAAEEFTFDLRNLERATVVGDTTGGGGHTVAGYVFDFDTFRMAIRIPYGRAYNPLNNEGWEGRGVIPHIAVPAEQALDAAHADALRKLMETEEDEQIRTAYAWALDFVAARLNPVELGLAQMEAYVGAYGPRRIVLEDGVLWYQREDRPRYRLEPLGEDRFKVGDLDYFMLEFGRDGSGAIDRVIGRYDSGRTDENPRDGA